jgi:hypothetical protein
MGDTTPPCANARHCRKDLRMLGYACRGDVMLGEGHRWRQRKALRPSQTTWHHSTIHQNGTNIEFTLSSRYA